MREVRVPETPVRYWKQSLGALKQKIQVHNQNQSDLFSYIDSYFDLLKHSIWAILMRQVATVEAAPIVKVSTWSVVFRPVSMYTKKT